MYKLRKKAELPVCLLCKYTDPTEKKTYATRPNTFLPELGHKKEQVTQIDNHTRRTAIKTKEENIIIKVRDHTSRCRRKNGSNSV